MKTASLRTNQIYGLCYTTTQSRKLVARQMLDHSYVLFFDADFVKYLDQIRVADRNGSIEDLMEALKNIRSHLLDRMRIFTCFEMYLKAELLLNGYVIHQFDEEFCKQNSLNFCHRQRDEPISIVDMKTQEGLAAEEKPENGCFRSLIDKTIEYNTVKGVAYKRVLHHLPDLDKLFCILDKVQEERNRLHFLPSQAISWGGDSPTLDDYAFLREYVKNNLVKRRNILVIEHSKENGESEADIESKLRNWGLLL